MSLAAIPQFCRCESQKNYKELVTLFQLRGIASCIKDALQVQIILKTLTHTIKFSASQGVKGQASLRSGSFE